LNQLLAFAWDAKFTPGLIKEKFNIAPAKFVM